MAVRCGAMRCGAMRCDAVRFGAVRFDVMGRRMGAHLALLIRRVVKGSVLHVECGSVLEEVG